MAEKKGAGSRPQEYDTQTGEYSNLPSAKNLVRNYERRFGEIKRASISLPDETIPRSLSAKWANEDIEMPDGGKAHFVEGTKLHHIEVFAGKGRKREIDVIERLVQEHPGSSIDDWQKVKGIGTIEYRGEQDEAEIHWYQEPSIGRVEYKFKRYI